MGKKELTPKTRYRKRRKRVKGKGEEEELKRLSKRILDEAKKIAQMEVQKAAIEVLSEATIIARWEKNPFYIV